MESPVYDSSRASRRNPSDERDPTYRELEEINAQMLEALEALIADMQNLNGDCLDSVRDGQAAIAEIARGKLMDLSIAGSNIPDPGAKCLIDI